MACCTASSTDLDRAAMCAACNGNRTNCQRSGKHVALHIRGEACPRGWHPDKAGVVRWLGVDWIGVPFPVRVWLYLRKGEGCPREWAARWKGCGCIASVKAYATRLGKQLTKGFPCEPVNTTSP